MSKFASFAEYPPRSLAGAEAALLTAWGSLARFQEGKDLFGATQKAAVPVSGIGALVVLKLNAFAGRQQSKDAYDVLLGVSRFIEGPDAAITAFRAEAAAGNRGYARAIDSLRRHFFETGHSGPLRCAAFALEGQTGIDDRGTRERQIVEQLVTIGRALAGEG